jgi:hypothetical protein
MFAKTTIAVCIAIVLSAASSAIAASDRASGNEHQVQTRQRTEGLNHPPYVTDAGRAYALDESSKPKKKVSKQQGTPTNLEQGKSSRAQAPSNSQTDEQAKQRRYEQNH